MDFDKWAQIHRVPAPVVDQLIQEELNDIESLKQCDESVLQMLYLDAAQYGILHKAVQRLKQGEEKLSIEESSFNEWATAHKLKPETIAKLEDEELNEIETLRHVTEDVLKSLNLKAGQFILLRKAVIQLKDSITKENQLGARSQEMIYASSLNLAKYEPYPDDPMIAYLVKKHIKQKTIEALHKHEFDSLDALKLVTDDDIQELNVSKGQARLLKVAVNELGYSEKSGENTVNHPKPPKDPMVVCQQTKQTKHESKEALTQHGFDSPESSKPMSEVDIGSLNMVADQARLLTTAIDELKQRQTKSNDDDNSAEAFRASTSNVIGGATKTLPSDPMTMYLKTKQIKDDTKLALTQHGFDTLKSLKLMTEEDIGSLKVVTGQARLLKAAINDLNQDQSGQGTDEHDIEWTAIRDWNEKRKAKPDDEFQTYMKGKQLKSETIKELCEMGFDSFKTVLLVKEADIQMMKAPPVQRRLLGSVLDEYKNERSTPIVHDGTTQNNSDGTTHMLPPPYTPPPENDQPLEQADPVTQLTKHLPPDFPTQDDDWVDFPNDVDGLDQAQGYTEYQYKAKGNANSTFGSYTPPYPTPSQRSRGWNHSQRQQKHRKQPSRKPKGRKSERWNALTKFRKYARTGYDNFVNYVGGKMFDHKIEYVNDMKLVKLKLKQDLSDDQNKVRRCTIGKEHAKHQQKTIMLVGATGAGKSTLIDGFCNYIFDAKWTEETRFRLIDEHADEMRNKAEGQSKSQTEWITVYTITSGDSNRLPYTLNLIDTPGFGDTRGIKRDQMLVDQIRALFSNPEKYKIDTLDAVCFLAKAPDARLTHTQKYIFDSILSIFGNDVGENILVMVTFADGAAPPVLEAIEAAKLPHRKHFRFNNSALFANNGRGKEGTDADACDFTKMFWEMGEKSFAGFFKFLTELDPKSLTLTKEVLEERQNLKDTLQFIESKIHKGIATMSTLRKEEHIFQLHEQTIKDNKDFTYTVTEVVSVQVDCELNRHVTHCMNCHFTCHERCRYKDDEDKARCSAMSKSTGKCKRCPQKCIWSDHKNSGFYLVNKEREVEKTYLEKQREYEKASGMKASQINMIEMIKAQYLQIQYDVENDVKKCRDILQRLGEIALKPDPLSEVDYIEMLIQAERDEYKLGWEDRVQELIDLKTKAKRLQDVYSNRTLLADI